MLVPDLAAVNWLWPFIVQDQIYGRSNFGHRFCLLALHIEISEQLHVIEAQERHEKSPKKRTSREAKCGSLGGLLIYNIGPDSQFNIMRS